MDAINELAAALAKAQGEIKGADKDRTNPHFNSKYATLDSVWNACRAPLASNGLAVVQILEQRDGGSFLVTRLIHQSGQAIESCFPWSLPGGAGKAQELGSYLTYLRRYALSALVGVAPTDDDDGEGASGRGHQAPEPPPQQQRRQQQRPTSPAPRGDARDSQRRPEPAPAPTQHAAAQPAPAAAPSPSAGGFGGAADEKRTAPVTATHTTSPEVGPVPTADELTTAIVAVKNATPDGTHPAWVREAVSGALGFTETQQRPAITTGNVSALVEKHPDAAAALYARLRQTLSGGQN